MTECITDNCTRVVVARGYCATCYARLRRQGVLDLKRPKGESLGADRCSFEGCDAGVKVRDLCGAHSEQRRRGSELRPVKRRRARVNCSVGGCIKDAAAFSSGSPLCNAHQSRWRRTGVVGDSLRDQTRTLGMLAINDAVANRDRSGCWTDWADLSCWAGLEGYGGNYNAGGYPLLGHDKVMHLALIADGRPRPKTPANHGLHSCDVKACWNPAHLRWGSHGENMADMWSRLDRCKHCPHCQQQ